MVRPTFKPGSGPRKPLAIRLKPGTRITVLLPREGRWFSGTVQKYDTKKALHVLQNALTSKRVDLRVVKWKLDGIEDCTEADIEAAMDKGRRRHRPQSAGEFLSWLKDAEAEGEDCVDAGFRKDDDDCAHGGFQKGRRWHKSHSAESLEASSFMDSPTAFPRHPTSQRGAEGSVWDLSRLRSRREPSDWCSSSEVESGEVVSMDEEGGACSDTATFSGRRHGTSACNAGGEGTTTRKDGSEESQKQNFGPSTWKGAFVRKPRSTFCTEAAVLETPKIVPNPSCPSDAEPFEPRPADVEPFEPRLADAKAAEPPSSMKILQEVEAPIVKPRSAFGPEAGTPESPGARPADTEPFEPAASKISGSQDDGSISGTDLSASVRAVNTEGHMDFELAASGKNLKCRRDVVRAFKSAEKVQAEPSYSKKASVVRRKKCSKAETKHSKAKAEPTLLKRPVGRPPKVQSGYAAIKYAQDVAAGAIERMARDKLCNFNVIPSSIPFVEELQLIFGISRRLKVDRQRMFGQEGTELAAAVLTGCRMAEEPPVESGNGAEEGELDCPAVLLQEQQSELPPTCVTPAAEAPPALQLPSCIGAARECWSRGFQSSLVA